jgi:hypothetical protein
MCVKKKKKKNLYYNLFKDKDDPFLIEALLGFGPKEVLVNLTVSPFWQILRCKIM